MSDTAAEDASSNALDALVTTEETYSNVLSLFQENHDQCVNSGFFPPETLLEVDACGVNFRSLGLGTISVATVVSNQWIDMVVLFFQYFSDYGVSAKDEFKRLGRQAKELGKLFEVLEVWSRKLAGRIHSTYEKVQDDVSDFKVTFAQELQDADLNLKAAKNAVEAKKADLEAKQAERDRWKYALYGSSVGYAIFFPIGAIANIITGTGYAVAKAAASSAQDAVYEAERVKNTKQQAYDAAKTKSAKAQLIGVTAGKLVNSMTGLEVICESMATFWTYQSDSFEVVGGAMETNMANLPHVVVERRLKDQAIADWNNTKAAFDRYCTIMTRIVNLFNFQTDAKKSPELAVNAAELSFTLRVPDFVDADAIMNPPA